MEAIAKLRNYPTSPRRMRLLADEIRGMEVERALALLEHHPQHSATPLFKLVKSAINNWEQKNEGQSAADAALVVKTIFVDGARTLKRMLPAPQGRAYRLRKRSNHVTVIIDQRGSIAVAAAEQELETVSNIPAETTASVPVKKKAAKKSTAKKSAPVKKAAKSKKTTKK
ncbi:MAG TPA: 50S ribosomal protein L22 [Flavitalea sp.]|nr:50S ribosomal protein L22 [Flavitalea sp.]